MTMSSSASQRRMAGATARRWPASGTVRTQAVPFADEFRGREETAGAAPTTGDRTPTTVAGDRARAGAVRPVPSRVAPWRAAGAPGLAFAWRAAMSGRTFEIRG